MIQTAPNQQTRAHREATAIWGVKMVVKSLLVLLGVVGFLVLEFGTDVARSIGGSSKQQAMGMVFLCFIPGLILYFPLAWLAVRWVKKRLALLDQRERGSV